MSVQELLALPLEERAELAVALLDSLDESTDAEWSEEIRRRVEDAAAGRVTSLTWSDARAAILDGQSA